MIKTLVLVRHGNPDRSFEGNDLDRPLTAAGRRALEDAMPRELSLLDRQGVTVWSSPAKRARQTAEVVCHVLHVSESSIKVHECLYRQDQDEFLDQLATAEGTVVAVGHVPFMEKVFERLCGSRMRFGKGSAACFEFPRGTVAGAELRWYVQGPNAERWETLICVEKRLAKAAAELERTSEVLLRDPGAGTLHDFRVAIRCARTLLTFVRPFQKRRQSVATDMILGDLQRATSFLRELDGLCGRADGMEDASSEAFIDLCRSVREEERARFVGLLRRRGTQRLLREACHGLRNTRWRAGIEDEGLSYEAFREEFDRLRIGVLDQFISCNLGNDDDTHTVRKGVKRVRYVAEEYGELLDQDQRQAAESARKLQSELGHLCDVRVDRDIVNVLTHRRAIDPEDPTVKAFLAFCEREEKSCVESLRGLQESLRQRD